MTRIIQKQDRFGRMNTDECIGPDTGKLQERGLVPREGEVAKRRVRARIRLENGGLVQARGGVGWEAPSAAVLAGGAVARGRVGTVVAACASVRFLSYPPPRPPAPYVRN